MSCLGRTTSTRATSVGCDGRPLAGAQAIGSNISISACISPGWSSISSAIRTPAVKALPITVQLCDPVRPMTVVNIGPAIRRRWEIMLMPGDDPARLTDPMSSGR